MSLRELLVLADREPKVLEQLVILQEECGELVQAISKLLRFGPGEKYTEGSDNNYTAAIKEAGDVYCMLTLLFDEQQLKFYAKNKEEKLRVYSSIFD